MKQMQPASSSQTDRLSREALVQRLRNLKPFLNERGVSHAALFGSRARGDHRDDSDVDMLIDVDRTRKFSLIDLVGIETDLSDEFGLPFSLVMRRSLTSKVASSIAKDVIEIF